ncbi:hypothetical protein HanIR_Chr14g0675231 [Helianthus annuus]|nr:hypothetical protein HanIR_Chr14g0675231 [Helianthus annuus]
MRAPHLYRSISDNTWSFTCSSPPSLGLVLPASSIWGSRCLHASLCLKLCNQGSPCFCSNQVSRRTGFPFQDSPTIHYGLCHQSPHLQSRFCSQTGCLSCRS